MNRSTISALVACAFFALVTPMTRAADAASPPMLRAAQLTDMQVVPTPATMRDGSLNKAFQPLASLRLPASTSRDHWYRLELSADWAKTQAPVISFKETEGIHGLLHIWIYAPPAYHPQRLRLGQHGSHPGLSNYTLANLLPADIRADQPVYVHMLKTLQQSDAIASFTDLSTFLATDSNHARLATAFYSVQVAMLLISLFLWLLLRDRLFLYFFGYISAQLIFGTEASGELFQLPGGWVFGVLGVRASAPFAMLTAVLAISFIIEFCNLRRIIPRAAMAFGALRWPLLATTPIILYAPARFDRWVFSLVNWLILLTCVMAIASVLVTLIKGNRQARFFFAAWLPLLAFTIFRVLQLQAGWDQPAWADYGFQFSMAFATLVITVGLADQIVSARSERDIADELAHHDQLTGAFNRRAVLNRLDAAVEQAHRNESPLAVLFLDADHFKVINDTHGHAVGDRCLQRIVEVVGKELRGEDWMGRYGGEEFVVVLPNANHANARMIAERLCASVEAHPLHVERKTIQITVSVGVAVILDSSDSAETLLERADAAVYQAKADGRNRIAMQPLLATAVGT